MSKKKCEECISWSFEMPKKYDSIIFDYQTDIRVKQKVALNKFKVLYKIIEEWQKQKIKT